VIHRTPLPRDIEDRIATLPTVLEECPGVLFAYLFGGMGAERPTPLSDVDVAVYLADGMDPLETRLDLVRKITAHLHTDEVDVVVLNNAPTALLGRILATRRVLVDRDAFRRHRFESRALREFFDFRVIEREHLARRFGRG
jgi:predicted nucleotidyltransferase